MTNKINPNNPKQVQEYLDAKLAKAQEKLDELGKTIRETSDDLRAKGILNDGYQYDSTHNKFVNLHKGQGPASTQKKVPFNRSDVDNKDGKCNVGLLGSEYRLSILRRGLPDKQPGVSFHLPNGKVREMSKNELK